MHNEDCIFCKIINRKINANIIYESKDVIAFYDIAPETKGHTLLVPKKHSNNYLKTDNVTLGKMAKEVKNVFKILAKLYNTEDFNLIVNNGKKAGQIVNHLHWHILPR